MARQRNPKIAAGNAPMAARSPLPMDGSTATPHQDQQTSIRREIAEDRLCTRYNKHRSCETDGLGKACKLGKGAEIRGHKEGQHHHKQSPVRLAQAAAPLLFLSGYFLELFWFLKISISSFRQSLEVP
jgi:hypothetical protein